MMANLRSFLSWGLLLWAVSSAAVTFSAKAHGTGIYKSEAEAQERAKQLGCDSVHQNNGRWMPCSDEAELHRMLRKE